MILATIQVRCAKEDQVVLGRDELRTFARTDCEFSVTDWSWEKKERKCSRRFQDFFHQILGVLLAELIITGGN